jgi:hypothetical protein
MRQIPENQAEPDPTGHHKGETWRNCDASSARPDRAEPSEAIRGSEAWTGGAQLGSGFREGGDRRAGGGSADGQPCQAQS